MLHHQQLLHYGAQSERKQTLDEVQISEQRVEKTTSVSRLSDGSHIRQILIHRHLHALQKPVCNVMHLWLTIVKSVCHISPLELAMLLQPSLSWPISLTVSSTMRRPMLVLPKHSAVLKALPLMCLHGLLDAENVVVAVTDVAEQPENSHLAQKAGPH